VRDLARFREAVRAHRRTAGRPQQQLARAMGLHPAVLSHKLNGTDSAVLTTADVVAIVTVLADWGVLVSRADAEDLLGLAAVPPHAISARSWAAPPLAALRQDAPAAHDTPAAHHMTAQDVDRASPHTAVSGVPVPAPAPAVPATPVTPFHPRPGAIHPQSNAVHPQLEASTDAGPPQPRLVAAPLPAPATALIGRERELAEVAKALASGRLVTLTGMGGTGKTRLALAAGGRLADRFRDGVAFVDLAPVSDPDLLAIEIADALGLAPPSASAVQATLTAALADRELLLILDNLEQLLDEVPLLTRLLAAAPALKILATSRIALRLYGEQTLRVQPFPLPGHPGPAPGGNTEAVRDNPAVRLFIERARAVRPDFSPDEDELAGAAEICTVLDGLPLAIELAASRTRLYPARALLSLLTQRLALLTGGPRDLPQRQQTLRAALDWSFDLLPEDEQRLFRSLGVFSGPFDATTAGALDGGDPMIVLEQLTELADHSMIEVTRGQEPRFQLLQTVREYALARLAEAGLYDQVRRRHLSHYLDLAEAAHRKLPSDHIAQLGVLQAAYPNIRTALEFACAQAELDAAGAGIREDSVACLEAGMRLATAVCSLWRHRGPMADGDRYLSRLLAAREAASAGEATREAVPASVRAAAAVEASALACHGGNYQRALSLSREAIALYESAGDHRGLAAAHRFAGEALFADGHYARAGDHFGQSLACARQAGDRHGQAVAANMTGQLHRHLGDHDRSREVLREAIRLFRDSGNQESAAFCLHSLAETERNLGHIVLASRLFTAALRVHDGLGSSRGIAYSLEGLASIVALSGQTDLALRYLGAARRARDTTGAQLPPVEQEELDRVLGEALADIRRPDRHPAFQQGRVLPVAATVAVALGTESRATA
jgi:predicted ATPase